jgi:DnaK suppressor protein
MLTKVVLNDLNTNKEGGAVMNKQDLNHFRQILESELRILQIKAGLTVIELTGSISDGEPDPLDRATQEIVRNSAYRIRSRESRLIKKIEDRLQSIEDGTYGICEDCEEPISIERLEARPVTSYCITCKMRREAHEKVIGS